MGRKKLEEMAPNVASPVGEFVEEYCVKPTFDSEGVQATSAIGRDGREYPDPVPMSAPLGYDPPMPLMDMMKLMIDRLREPQNDFDIEETEEEANDFDTEEERVDRLTPYEEVFMPKAPVVVFKPDVPPRPSGSEAPPAPVVSAEVLKPT